MYTPLFAITAEEEDNARAIIRHLLQHGGDGLKNALRGNKGLTVIHSWGDTFGACTDAAWGLRRYLPHVLFVYITPEEKNVLKANKRWRCMELCQSYTFPAICLFDKTDGTILTCHMDTAGIYHPARYMLPTSQMKAS